jgi:hypothetical protein
LFVWFWTGLNSSATLIAFLNAVPLPSAWRYCSRRGIRKQWHVHSTAGDLIAANSTRSTRHFTLDLSDWAHTWLVVMIVSLIINYRLQATDSPTYSPTGSPPRPPPEERYESNLHAITPSSTVWVPRSTMHERTNERRAGALVWGVCVGC